MPAGFVNVKLENAQLTVESNLSESEQIALLEAAKFQTIARNSGLLPNTVRPVIQEGVITKRSPVGGLIARRADAGS